MRKIDGPKVPVNYEREQLDRLQGIANKLGITRAEATRRTLNIGLDVFELYQSTGLVELAEIVKRVRGTCEKGTTKSLL